MNNFLLSLLFVLSINVFSHEVSSIDQTLNILKRIYFENPEHFGGAKVGFESGYNDLIISQENIIAELERDLEFDEGFCEYKTEADFVKNITLLEEKLSPRANRIIRKLRNDGHIEHISSRTISFQNIEEDCEQQQIRIILNNGSLVWFDFI